MTQAFSQKTLFFFISIPYCWLRRRPSLVGPDRLTLQGKWIWGHFKWPVLSLATLKGGGWPFAACPARSLRFRKELTEKKNLCLRLRSNYTWHVNSREGSQSRKLAPKEDRREDQEWHRMSLNSSLLYPLLLCLPLAAGLLLPVVFSFFRLATACCLALSFFLSGLLSLLLSSVCEYFVRLPLHSQMDSLSALAVQICLSLWFLCRRMRCFFFLLFPFQVPCQTLNICIIQSKC